MNNLKERTQAITNAALHPNPATLGVLGIMSLTALLGFLFLGNKSIMHDEAVSIAIAQADWPTLWQIISRFEVNMGLYNALLHLWINLGGSEFVIRSLSVVFSILTVPAMYQLGNQLFNRRAGLLAALLMVVNSFFIRFAQQARGYSLLLLLVTMSSLLLVMAVRRPSKRVWAAYIIVSSLAMYTHVYAAFVLAAQAISLIFLRRREIPWKGLAVSAVAIALLIFPLLFYYLTANPTNLDYAKEPALGFIYGVFLAITGGSHIVVTAYFIPCFIIFIYAIKQWLAARFSLETWRYGLLLVWLAAPVIIAFGISQFKPIFFSRYFIICLPALVLLASQGIWRIHRLWSWVLIAFLLASSGYQTYQWYAAQAQEEWRESSSYVLSQTEENDVIVFYTPSCSNAFNYYRDMAGTTVEIPVMEPYYDPVVNSTIPVLNTPEAYGMSSRLPEPDVNLAERLSKYSHIWLVLSHDANVELGRDVQSQTLQNLLQEKYGAPTEKDFPLVRVFMFTTQAD